MWLRKKIDGRHDDETKNLPTFSILKKSTGADYLILGMKKCLLSLYNAFF